MFTSKTAINSYHFISRNSGSLPKDNRQASTKEFHCPMDICRYANNNLTWLQRQQLKLKERREMKLREERQPHETRLISELRSVHQSRHMRPTASHRLDGYTSDTTAFADDDDDFAVPLHINTLARNGNGAVRNFSQKFEYQSTKNERPFMAVKKAHERYAQVSAN